MTTNTPRSTPARVIAIDGPAASGKSAVGVGVAARLGYRFLDTGAMYRAVTWLALRRGIDTHDPDRLAELSQRMSIDVHEAPPHSAEATAVVIENEDATAHLRDPSVEANVSMVSRVPAVRRALVRIQQRLAAEGGVVMAGRDIGTVVLPHADLKIYLDASREVRARRRMQQMTALGSEAELEAIIRDLERRDGIDSSRETSPLTPAVDAVIINTDSMTVEDAIERILGLAT